MNTPHTLKEGDMSLLRTEPKTTSEKLVWERNANKLLIKENRELEDDFDKMHRELHAYKTLMLTDEKGALILKNKKLHMQRNELIVENKMLTSKVRTLNIQKDNAFRELIQTNLKNEKT